MLRRWRYETDSVPDLPELLGGGTGENAGHFKVAGEHIEEPEEALRGVPRPSLVREVQGLEQALDLSLGIVDILAQMVLCCAGCPVYL